MFILRNALPNEIRRDIRNGGGGGGGGGPDRWREERAAALSFIQSVLFRRF